MKDFIFFMHDDATSVDHEQVNANRVAWKHYIETLQAEGVFLGGSSIGPGRCKNKSDSTKEITKHLVGYVRVRAESFRHAEALLAENPVFEAGGTVEIRELPVE